MGNQEIRNRFTGDIIIPAGKYASLKEAVEKEYKNLTLANLTRADLTEANLTRANLTRANLTLANLTRANLTEANLTEADLTLANLTRANLTEANLTEADLTRAKIYGEIITKIPIQISGLGWWINITQKHIQIGCQIHEAEKWFKFNDKEISTMHSDALIWWNKNKKLIKSIWQHHNCKEGMKRNQIIRYQSAKIGMLISKINELIKAHNKGRG